MLRIFLADDHTMIREGLKALINAEQDMQVVGEAADGREAYQQICECRPDVAVMDISMPHLNGLQATAEIRRTCPEVHVLTLSIHEETSYLRNLLEAGASGYILKRSAAEVLVTAIRTVAVGGVYLDPQLAGRVVNAFVGKAAAAPALDQLSERELEVLRQIARGYSNKEIAARLDLSIKTIETYKARAMQKLGLDSRVAIVRYAVKQGWLA
jgi:two-component system response regulator NreC